MKYLLIIAVVVAAFFLFEAWSRAPAVMEPEPLVFRNESLSLEPNREMPEPMEETSPSLETALSNITAPLPAPTPAPSEPTLPIAPPETSQPASEPTPSSVTIVDRLISFGFRTPPTSRTVNAIVLHSSYNASGGDVYNLDKIIGQYEEYSVGAHYLIDRSGTIYRLVRESDIAYHAGASKMPDGRQNVNDFSIGIELVGTEDSGFSEKQYDTLNALIADIKTRHQIKDIVGHGDVAPKRKTDPWKFDWKKFE